VIIKNIYFSLFLNTEGSEDRSVSQSQNKSLLNKTIHICHANPENIFKFMYKPITLSVLKLIDASIITNNNLLYSKLNTKSDATCIKNHCSILCPQSDINPYFSTESENLVSKLNCSNDVKINYKIVDNNNFDEINSNDILIWIGWEAAPNFEELKKKGIYTIWFNSEPYYHKKNSDEIWTYSKYLFDNYKNDNQILRFIPIICEENIPCVPYNLINNNIKLVFMGNLNYRPEKKEYLLKSKFLQENLEEVYNIWNDDDYNNFINKKSNIFLNLTKSINIDIKYVLPSVRINKLLSHKCIIISEYTNPIDEEYYKDMVYFCNLEDIEDLYKKLISKSSHELKQESDRIYEKFYNKFYYKNALKLITQK
jgi:hypothetical protein